MNYEPVIGLETHVQLGTKSKLFCACPADFGSEPNKNTCPVCLGWPGSLPVLNEAALRLAIKNLHVAYGPAPGALQGKSYSAVLARALAPLPETLSVTAPLVAQGTGVLIVHQTDVPDFEAPALRKALERSRTRVDSVLPYRLPKETRDRHLAIFRR